MRDNSTDRPLADLSVKRRRNAPSREQAGPRRVTIVDVANSVGLSTYAVSRALNGHQDIAKTTQERILEAARQLGYTPNNLARTLRRDRTDTVSILLTPSPDTLISPYFLPIITELEATLARAHLNLLIAGGARGEDEIEVLRRLVQGRRTDAIVLTRVRASDPRAAFLADAGFPFVSLGRTEDDPACPFVDADYRESTRLATQWLIELGHRQMALITTPFDVHSSGEHVTGCRAALKSAGLSMSDAFVLEGNYTSESGRDLGRRLLAMHPRPTAILCGNDEMASGVAEAVVDLGLVVGQDVSIIGCDDTPIAQFVRPQLTTFRSSVPSFGSILGQQVLALLNGKRPGSHFIIPELIRRGSVGEGPFP